MSNKFAGQIRVSASRIKSLHKCSYKFYLNEVERLPENTHPKTLIGSLCHSILESLKRPRGREYYDIIVKDGTIYNTPFARLVKMWKQKHNLSDELIADVDSMILLVLTQVNFYHIGATQVFPPETEFKMELKTGIVKGFIDDFAIYGDKALIRDYKSQKERFTAEELKNEYQAAVYQLYIWKTYKLPADVEFIMLRHPPTKRTPDKHIQKVPAKTKEQLKGFEIYLENMGTLFKNFGLEDAYSNFAADNPKTKFFCQYICQFRDPFDYIALIDKDGKVDKTYRSIDDIPNPLPEGHSIQKRSHKGCPRFHKS